MKIEFYELNTLKENPIKEIIQLLYDKGVFDGSKTKIRYGNCLNFLTLFEF